MTIELRDHFHKIRLIYIFFRYGLSNTWVSRHTPGAHMLRAVSALLLKFSLPPTSKYYILYTTSLMTAMPVCTCTRVQYSGPHVEWIFGPTTRPAYFTFLSGRRSFRPPSGHHIHLTIRTLELTSVTYRVGRSSGEINVQKISPK